MLSKLNTQALITTAGYIFHPPSSRADRLPGVPLLVDLLPEVIFLMDLLPEVPLPVDLLPPQPPDLHQLLSSEATGVEATLVAGIRVGSSTRQPLFQPTPERGEVGRMRGSAALTCLLV